MLEILLFFPIGAGAAMLLIGNTALRRALLMLAAMLHLVLSALVAAAVNGATNAFPLRGWAACWPPTLWARSFSCWPAC